MVIDRAVILAAGRGRRLGELTENAPKPMSEIGDVPLIERIVVALVAAGVRSLTVVTGYLANVLERHLAATSPIPVSFVRQLDRNGTAGAVRVARHAVGYAPFLLCWGDIATAPEHYARVAEAWRPGLAGAVGVNMVDDVSRLSAVVFGEDFRIEAVVEKPADEPPSLWSSTGIFAFGPEVWAHLDTIRPSARGELEMPDAINSLIAAGDRLEAVPLLGPWFDVGTPESLAAARQAFSP